MQDPPCPERWTAAASERVATPRRRWPDQHAADRDSTAVARAARSESRPWPADSTRSAARGQTACVLLSRSLLFALGRRSVRRDRNPVGFKQALQALVACLDVKVRKRLNDLGIQPRQL